MPGMFKISSLESLNNAVDLIVDQGEGASLGNARNEAGVFAHYFKFAECYVGYKFGKLRVVDVPGETYHKFIYELSDQEVPWDQDGITSDIIYTQDEIERNVREVNIIENNDQKNLPYKDYFMRDFFNKMYGGMLEDIEFAFNNDPDAQRTFGTAVARMRKLQTFSISMLHPYKTKGASIRQKPVMPSFDLSSYTRSRR